jgi:hypothetical protein
MISRISLLSYALFTLAACGGGGGGGGGGPTPLVYSGSTIRAVVATTNASRLTANVTGDGNAASTITSFSAQSSNAAQNPSSGLVGVSRRLSRDFRDIAVRTKAMSSAQQGVAVQVDQTQACDLGNGTVRIFGPLDNMTGTGTVTVIFTNCLLTGITVNGPATMRIDAFDLGNVVITDSTISFARLTLRATGLSLDAGGSLRNQVNIATNTETLTSNLVQLDNNKGLMTKTANLVLVSVFDNIVSPTSFTSTIAGQVFDSVLGYVDVTTPAVLVFATVNQLFPTSGQMLLTGTPAGAGNRKILATALLAPPAALPATLAQLELDLDGDNIYEVAARLKWTDLTGPVGADLGDDDGDGMHNSWETVNGFDPLVNDAAADFDSDGFTNLAEYMAGTDPKLASSHP